MKQIVPLLSNPTKFFENSRDENWKPALRFFLEITALLAVATPIVNYLGVESTDYSSSYQAQIAAYNLLKDFLLPQYGTYAYLMERCPCSSNSPYLH